VADTLKDNVLEWTLNSVELQDFNITLGSLTSASNSSWRRTFNFFRDNETKFVAKCGDALMLLQNA